MVLVKRQFVGIRRTGCGIGLGFGNLREKLRLAPPRSRRAPRSTTPFCKTIAKTRQRIFLFPRSLLDRRLISKRPEYIQTNLSRYAHEPARRGFLRPS